MSCIVCNLDIGESAAHRECLLHLFRTTQIKSIQDWIRLSSKPKTIVKGRVFRVLERSRSEGTQREAS
jgi:hypothetical protein